MVLNRLPRSGCQPGRVIYSDQDWARRRLYTSRGYERQCRMAIESLQDTLAWVEWYRDKLSCLEYHHVEGRRDRRLYSDRGWGRQFRMGRQSLQDMLNFVAFGRDVLMECERLHAQGRAIGSLHVELDVLDAMDFHVTWLIYSVRHRLQNRSGRW